MNNKIYKPFQFKRFSVHHANAAMKVGTDGILLGAWTNCTHKRYGIDIGTGTGVIAMMICQRNSNVQMDAIEISNNACQDAELNFKQSPWENRINLIQGDIKKLNTSKKYDLIICNPPFFQDSLLPKDKDRAKARHDHDLNYSEILDFSNKYINENGIISIILPVEQGMKCVKNANEKRLYVNRLCMVYPKPEKKAHRILLEISNNEQPIIKEELIIENNERHNYTKDYKNLTREFYTIF